MTSRDAVRGKNDRLYQATIDGGGLACGDKVVSRAGRPYPVLAGEDDGWYETKAERTKAGDVCG